MLNIPELTSLSRETDEKIKAEKKEKLAKETVPFYLEKLDDISKANNGYLARCV